jgi:hypothetical protein
VERVHVAGASRRAGQQSAFHLVRRTAGRQDAALFSIPRRLLVLVTVSAITVLGMIVSMDSAAAKARGRNGVILIPPP